MDVIISLEKTRNIFVSYVGSNSRRSPSVGRIRVPFSLFLHTLFQIKFTLLKAGKVGENVRKCQQEVYCVGDALDPFRISAALPVTMTDFFVSFLGLSSECSNSTLK